LLSTTIFCPGLRVAAGRQHTQAAALAQEKIHDGQVPLTAVGSSHSLPSSSVSAANPTASTDAKFFQSPDQVFSDGGVVFNNIGAEFHSLIQESGAEPGAWPKAEPLI
jgi:hypothetical protein